MLALGFSNIHYADDVDCGGASPWEFGTKTVGELDDQSSPFIKGQPPGRCDFREGEKEQIVANLLAKATDTLEERIAVFTMGGSGCGKSSSLNKTIEQLGFSPEQFVVIDPDDIRTHIKAYKKATRIPSKVCKNKFRAYAEATPWCRESAVAIRVSLFDNVIEQKKSFIFDYICGYQGACTSEMQKAKDEGFTVYLVGVWASPEKCVERSLGRALETGRLSPAVFVERIHEGIKNAKAFTELAKIATDSGGDAYIYDNDGKSTRLVFQKSSDTECDPTEKSCWYFSP